jgi:hypothetical protein
MKIMLVVLLMENGVRRPGNKKFVCERDGGRLDNEGDHIIIFSEIKKGIPLKIKRRDCVSIRY